VSRPVRNALLVSLALVGLIQLVPVSRSNPPVTADQAAPPAVQEVLRRACYDCHSNETVWPWYSRVAPVSWLLAHDVSEGRDALNFSKTGALLPKVLTDLKAEIWQEVSAGEMPPKTYLLTHSHARLSDADREVLGAWIGPAGRSEGKARRKAD